MLLQCGFNRVDFGGCFDAFADIANLVLLVNVLMLLKFDFMQVKLFEKLFECFPSFV